MGSSASRSVLNLSSDADPAERVHALVDLSSHDHVDEQGRIVIAPRLNAAKSNRLLHLPMKPGSIDTRPVVGRSASWQRYGSQKEKYRKSARHDLRLFASQMNRRRGILIDFNESVK